MKDKFLITICCQGQPFYKKAGTLEEAVECFKAEYLEKNKYGTMNFTLEVGNYNSNKIWDEVE